ncbi:uncharacterized protein B0J16DRAFT_365943 [Fusarium flagelliforme]|uniref:Uncharacterized protein n=1 Tax=Fusarium flagelliforme TaxID=2675880 RepID=A0A395N7C5_9HYPO|nr:uncharacterized protein B0J16DRAFT_365943 [Fusarium flagelliforme]KAH7196645.1 hypothetical protein B0J16DRAFT_365943 [Fusarium flagelliforme]RFN55569.1 hypothetical protein FIE12Z_215 [Fusarium flagelliforme]
MGAVQSMYQALERCMGNRYNIPPTPPNRPLARPLFDPFLCAPRRAGNSAWDGEITNTIVHIYTGYGENGEELREVVPPSPKAHPSPPRTTFEEQLWIMWHDRKCRDHDNCTHSFDAEYTDWLYAKARASLSMNLQHSTPTSTQTSPVFTPTTDQSFGTDQETDSLSVRASNGGDVENGRSGIAVLRRSWSAILYRKGRLSIKTPPLTA